MDARYSPVLDSNPLPPPRGEASRKPVIPNGTAAGSRCAIPPAEVSFQPHSFADPSGRVFLWNGHLYRGLRGNAATHLGRLVREGTLTPLVERGLLIETTIKPMTLAEYDLIVQHRRVRVVSYPQEWCPAMFKRAVRHIVDLALELAGHGLMLKDAHPWNVLYEGTAPVFIDWGSIVSIEESEPWSGLDEFHRFCLNPLKLMSRNLDHLARAMLPTDRGVTDSDVAALCGNLPSRRPAGIRARQRLARLTESIRGRLNHSAEPRRCLTEELRRLREEVERVPVPEGAASTHVATRQDRRTASEAQDERTATLRRVIRSIGPATMLAIGGRDLMEVITPPPCEATLVAFDADPSWITDLYRQVDETQGAILPLIMDLTKPTPSIGWGSHWAIDARERFRSQLVVAADVAHLAKDRHFAMPLIVEGLAAFASRWLIVEWTNPAERSGSSGGRSEVRCEEFAAALETAFRDVRCISVSQTTRVIVCER